MLQVVILGDTNDTSLIERMSRDCDLLVHEATMGQWGSDEESGDRNAAGAAI